MLIDETNSRIGWAANGSGDIKDTTTLARKFEETVRCQCHSGYSLDGTPPMRTTASRRCVKLRQVDP